jgi:hypothetical protein
VLIRKLYESFALEKITENRFEMLLNDYEQEQTALEETISKSQTELNTFHADTDRAEQFLALSKKYTDFSELTTPMINEFIDKILVHAPQRIDGDRTQEVDIYLKFIGKFEVPVEPMPEPTPEELEARRQWLEKREHRRARDRAYYAKTKAKREAEKAAAITLEETSPV